MSHWVPKYCHHKGRNLAFVKLNGRQHYLGRYGSPESRQAYDELIARWLPTRSLPEVESDEPPETDQPAGLTLNDLADAFDEFAAGYYGTEPRAATHGYRNAMNWVCADFGDTLAASFSPSRLLAVRDKMIAAELRRTTINMHTSRIKRVFRWAASRELLPADVYQRLACVEGIHKGRTAAKESKRVLPVSDAVIAATCEKLPPVLADMVRLQRVTGMRSGELCRMRSCDVDRSDPNVWLYRVAKHKTEHHGHERIVPLGPKAQAILSRYLLRDPLAPCFSPRESEAKRLAARHEQRQTPLSCGNRPKGKPNSRHNLFYTSGTYRQAIERACDSAKVPR